VSSMLNKIATLQQNELDALVKTRSGVDSLVTKLEAIEKTISSVNFPNRLDKIDTTISSINLSIQNLLNRVDANEQSLKKELQDVEDKVDAANNTIAKVQMLSWPILVMVAISLLLLLLSVFNVV